MWVKKIKEWALGLVPDWMKDGVSKAKDAGAAVVNTVTEAVSGSVVGKGSGERWRTLLLLLGMESQVSSVGRRLRVSMMLSSIRMGRSTDPMLMIISSLPRLLQQPMTQEGR